MSIDIFSVLHNAALLAALLTCCAVVYLCGRFLAGWSAVILFCLGQWGWALLALFVWHILEREHRAEMFRVRLLRVYNGPWID